MYMCSVSESVQLTFFNYNFLRDLMASEGTDFDCLSLYSHIHNVHLVLSMKHTGAVAKAAK
jgi:hypothetical protein